ncbi:MAG: DM13 domain-containing protein [Cyclobacteriaceae bacterium]
MRVIAKANIDGPEARGQAEIIELDSDQLELRLSNFWVAPGAPDVHIVLSQNPQGKIDDTAIDIAPYTYGNTEQTYPVPKGITLQHLKTIIVYCKKYTVHFGYGNIEF